MSDLEELENDILLKYAKLADDEINRRNADNTEAGKLTRQIEALSLEIQALQKQPTKNRAEIMEKMVEHDRLYNALVDMGIASDGTRKPPTRFEVIGGKIHKYND